MERGISMGLANLSLSMLKLTCACWQGCPAVFLGSASGSLRALDTRVGEMAWTSREEGCVCCCSRTCWMLGCMYFHERRNGSDDETSSQGSYGFVLVRR